MDRLRDTLSSSKTLSKPTQGQRKKKPKLQLRVCLQKTWFVLTTMLGHHLMSPLNGLSVVDSGLSDHLKERTTLPEK